MAQANQAIVMTRAASLLAFTQAMIALELTATTEPIRISLAQNDIANMVDLFSLSEEQIQGLTIEEELKPDGTIKVAKRTCAHHTAQ